MPKRRLPRLAATAVLALALISAALCLERVSVLVLPVPSGPFPAGRVTYDWLDPSHADALAPLPDTKRELAVWIWYPAAAGRSPAATSDYLPPAWRAAIQRSRPALLRFLTRDLSKVRAHAIPGANISRRQVSFPVVLLRAGASAEVTNYSTLAEDLASHGYIVVGFDAPYRTSRVVFPDGRVIAERRENNPELCLGRPDQEACALRLLAAWTGDMSFVIDRLERLNASDPSGRFTGRLDLTRVGAMGHSFGGAAAALFCRQDGRCKAAIDVDGAPHGSVIQSGIDRPFLFVLSDHSRESDPESREIRANIQSIYDRLPPGARFRVSIRGANHFTFSDDGALLKSSLFRGVLRVFGKLAIGGRRQLAITAYCVRTFFDAYLNGAAPPQLASPLYPEIELQN